MNACDLSDRDPFAVTDRVERALLGAVLTVGVLPKTPPRPEDFVRQAHRVAWTAILALAERGEEPEIIPVLWDLDKTGQLERAGGIAYVTSHLDSTDCSNLSQYARMVKEAAQMRKLKRMSA